MKIISAILVALWVSTCWTNAQTISSSRSASSVNPGQTAPSDTPYAVVDRGANQQVWQRTTYETRPDGKQIPHIHKYNELATGLNYWDSTAGQWVESKEQIEILPNGTAAAIQGQHQAYFPGDIYQGVVELVTPDGIHLQSRPLGLSYDDGANTVLIAELKDSVGQLVGPNQVIYPDAFTDFKADLRYTYTKAGFEQDIILREQPLTPESFGLNPVTARLQVLSEFFNPPQPAVTTARLPKQAGITLTDENLDFGVMKMMPGRAFLLGSDAHEGGALVSKSWVMLDGRQFLVEEVPVEALVNELAQLPVPQTASTKPNVNSTLHVVSAKRLLPASRLTKTSPGGRLMRVAQAASSSRGLVLDYVTMTTQTNYTFQGDTTYYISGSLNLWYTNTFEGGAVIKYTNGASIYLVPVSAGLNWRASAYRPVVFTAMDDNSVGESISGSTGNPTNYYANPALQLVGLSSIPTISYFRIAYAKQAMYLAGVSPLIANGQIVNCQNGITVNGANTIRLRNVLFGNVQKNFNNLYEGNFDVQNSTFSGSSYLSTIQNQPYQSSSVILTNCLLANVTNLQNTYTNIGYYQVNGGYNGFYNSLSFGTGTFTNTFYPFQTVGAGNYYLTNGCGFQNVGTTNIDSALLAALRQKTTYPPVILTNAILSNTILGPVAPRDIDVPDLGYHYDPIDYLSSCIVSNATLTITKGTVLAYNYSDWAYSGLWFQEGSQFTSQGIANQRNYIVDYRTSQEEPVTFWTIYTNTYSLQQSKPVISYHTDLTRNPSIYLNFTTVISQNGSYYNFYTDDNYVLNSFNLINCELYFSGAMMESSSSSINLPSRMLKNNLFMDPIVYVSAGQIVTHNNLFVGGSSSYVEIDSGGASVCTNQDNAFDGCESYMEGTIGHNAYLNGATIYSIIQVSDIITNMTWLSVPLGNYYQPANSLLINAGSTTADQLGLYHFTTQTNQVKETNSIVDIGYHYVAVDTNGIPIDSNGDGIPDYLEDANGNGLVNSGEIGWNIYGDLGLKVIITRPRAGGPLP